MRLPPPLQSDRASIPASIEAVDEVLAAAGAGRAVRTRIARPRVAGKPSENWPRAGRIKKANGLELLQSPLFLGMRPRGKRDSTAEAKPKVAEGVGMPWLRHAFSTRVGGASRVYQLDEEATGDLNLGWTAEDDPALVAENRARFVAAVVGGKRAQGASSGAQQLVTLRQIHSGLIHVFCEQDVKQKRLSTAEGRAALKGDGMMTNAAGLLLGIQTADCIPVLIADPRRKAVAAFHAGWRGTLARIVERGVGRMRLEYGSDPRELIAAIGPGIGPCCYSIGEEVRHEFESQFHYADELFSEVYDRDPIREKYPMLFLTQRAPGHSDIGPQTHLDLWRANLLQLLDAGVPRKNITVTGECTACHPQRYFSHRAQHGFTGRMMNVIGRA